MMPANNKPPLIAFRPGILWIGVLVVLGVLGQITGKHAETSERAKTDAAKNKEAACASVRQAIDATKLIMKHDSDFQNVHVNRAWYGTTFEEKQNFAVAVAQCLTPYEGVTIYDGYSGKKLASYGSWSRFSVE